MSKNRNYEQQMVNFENNIDIDTDTLSNTEIRINPSFYQHLNLLKAQDSLVKDDVKAGMLQYFVNAEHMEVLCRASNNLPPQYDEDIKAIKKITNEDDLIGMARAATKKYEILLSYLFSRVEKKGFVQIKKADYEKAKQERAEEEDE